MFFLFLLLFYFFPLAAKTSIHSKIIKRESVQHDFFKFAGKFFTFCANIQNLTPKNNHKEIYSFLHAPEGEKITLDLERMFNEHRPTLIAMKKFANLHHVHGLPLIPHNIYQQMVRFFSISPKEALPPVRETLLKIVGGKFFLAQNTVIITGFLTHIKKENMALWLPVKTFLSYFHETLATSISNSNSLIKSCLPVAEHYYNYMDTISRLRIFKEIVEDKNLLLKLKRTPNRLADELAIKIFQSSGPILIKLLQELQEITVGQTSMSYILEGLKHSKPMSIKKALNDTVKELKRVSGEKITKNNFSFLNRPLGIASIAQTHKFTYNDTDYVVKIQKPKIKHAFIREKKFLNRMVQIEEVFDKGMRQKLNNISQGIEEELDFSYERSFVATGEAFFSKPSMGLSSISIPNRIYRNNVTNNSQVLIMSLAAGEPLSSIIERGERSELRAAYAKLENLYRLYLKNALGSEMEFNFYHGDPHRDNIFFDTDKNKLTLIDYGNAGIITSHVKQFLINILTITSTTYDRTKEEIDQAIDKMGVYIKQFIASLKDHHANNKQNDFITNFYFDTCFNSQSNMRLRKKQRIILNEALIKNEQALLDLRLENLKEDKQKIKQLNENIGFIKAVMYNCLNGYKNHLLSGLRSNKSPSEKLNIVFAELQKNGIVMPKEIIFFNKGKSLIEGLSKNINLKLKSLGDKQEDSLSKLYLEVIGEI